MTFTRGRDVWFVVSWGRVARVFSQRPGPRAEAQSERTHRPQSHLPRLPGQYDPTELLNLGANRWSFRPELYIDALGVALFAIQATHKVWDLRFGWPLGPVLLGIVTAIGGGLIRDVLAGRPTLLMQRELYAVPVFLGCTLFVILLELLPEYAFFSSSVCALFIFALRAAAIRWDLGVPDWFATKPKTV